MTLAELQQACKVWQERLRLQGWIVGLHIVPATELGDVDVQGRTYFQDTHKWARILICDDHHFATNQQHKWPEHDDQEETLVHELLHLHFQPLHIAADCPEATAEELAINCLAKALVALGRVIPQKKE